MSFLRRTGFLQTLGEVLVAAGIVFALLYVLLH